MAVVDRYVARLGVARLALVLGAVAVVAALIEGTQPGGEKAPFWAPLLRVPLLAVEIAPVATLLAMTWTLETLREREELAALRCAGAGVMLLCRAAVVLGSLCAMAVALCGELWVPPCERWLERLGYERPALPPIGEAVAIREGDRVIFADGSTFRWLPDGTLERLPTSAPLQGAIRTEAVPLGELGRAIVNARRQGQDVVWASTIWALRAAQPLTCLVGALLGLAIGWRVSRHATAVALGVSVLWAGATVLFTTLCGGGALAPIFAGVGPILLGLLFSAAFLLS